MGQIILTSTRQEKNIKLETRLGSSIENNQLSSYTPFEINQFSKIKRDYPTVIFKDNPIPFSNCHGYTFSASRTGIWDSNSILKILEEDGYTEILDHSQVLPGDVILYWSQDGDAEHSGIVITKPDDKLKVPLVVGRWGRYSEAIHWAHISPYDFNFVKYYRVTK
jgi:hypothetical protein